MGLNWPTGRTLDDQNSLHLSLGTLLTRIGIGQPWRVRLLGPCSQRKFGKSSCGALPRCYGAIWWQHPWALGTSSHRGLLPILEGGNFGPSGRGRSRLDDPLSPLYSAGKHLIFSQLVSCQNQTVLFFIALKCNLPYILLSGLACNGLV